MDVVAENAIDRGRQRFADLVENLVKQNRKDDLESAYQSSTFRDNLYLEFGLERLNRPQVIRSMRDINDRLEIMGEDKIIKECASGKYAEDELAHLSELEHRIHNNVEQFRQDYFSDDILTLPTIDMRACLKYVEEHNLKPEDMSMEIVGMFIIGKKE